MTTRVKSNNIKNIRNLCLTYFSPNQIWISISWRQPRYRCMEILRCLSLK